MRYELPPGLSDEEVRVIETALDTHFGTAAVRPSPWALAGRSFAIGLGALQIRYQSLHPWSEITLNPFARLGTEPRNGRGDAK